MDFEQPVSEGSFQVLPDALLHERIERVDNEKSAIRLEQCPRLDQAKVRPPDSVTVYLPLNGAEDVLEFRIRFNDNGDTLGPGVIDDNIDVKFGESILLRLRWLQSHHRCRLFFLRTKPVEVAHDVLEDIIKIALNPFIRKLLTYIIDGFLDDR